MNADESANLVCAVIEALYGPRSENAELAEMLGVNVRTVRRWRNGTAEPGRGAWRDMLVLVEDRRAVLNRLASELPKRF